jgi:hypothetical protein
MAAWDVQIVQWEIALWALMKAIAALNGDFRVGHVNENCAGQLNMILYKI